MNLLHSPYYMHCLIGYCQNSIGFGALNVHHSPGFKTAERRNDEIKDALLPFVHALAKDNAA